MSDLNLVTGESESASGPKMFTPSFLISIVILILVLVIWGGIIAGQKYLDGKASAAQTQYQAEYQKFLAGNAKGVSDFQNRIQIAGNLLKNQSNMNTYLSAMEKDIVPPVYLTSFSCDDSKKTLTISGTANNYNTLAKQLLSFKNDSLFSSVELGGGSLGSEGQNGSSSAASTTSGPSHVNFSIDLGLK